LVGFGSPQVQHDTLAHMLNVAYVQPDQFGAPERARKPNHQQSAVTNILEALAYSIEHEQEIVPEKGLCLSLGTASGPFDAPHRRAD
jgi:hypothetical protein